MAGRNRQPIDVLLSNGKKHLTKAEIAERKESELHLGTSELICPDFVLNDPVAFKKWQEMLALYEGKTFVESGDTGHLARYCKTFSEYIDLLEHRYRTQNMERFNEEEQKQVIDEFATHIGERAAVKMWQKVEYIMSVSGLLAIDKAINSKMAALVAMEDRLFLNPLAKIKNVPKKEQEKPKDALEEAGFNV